MDENSGINDIQMPVLDSIPEIPQAPAPMDTVATPSVELPVADADVQIPNYPMDAITPAPVDDYQPIVMGPAATPTPDLNVPMEPTPVEDGAKREVLGEPIDGEVGTKTDRPSIYEEAYFRIVERKYEDAIWDAISRLAKGELHGEELERTLMDAIQEYSRGVSEQVTAIERREQAEAELAADYDNDLKEQLRVQRELNRKIKARVKEIKEQQRNERLQQQLAAAQAQTAVLTNQLNTLHTPEEPGMPTL